MSEMRRLMMMFTRPIGAVPPPIISPFNSAISSSQAISITISGSAVSAEYSFDGENWVIYSAQFTISADSTVYARAIDARGEYSRVVTKSYTIRPYDAQVEYIESSGTQYIDTGINCRQMVEATYSFAFSTVPTGVNILFGAYWNNSPSVPRMQFYYNNVWKDVSASLYTTTGTGIAQNGKATAGTIYTVTTKNKSSQASDSTLWVFARNSDDNTPLYANNLRIYSLSMTSGGVLVRDFIPVRVGQIGYLYDRVSGELFGNSGSGNFTIGNDVTT